MRVDTTVLAATGVLALLSGLLFAVLPALRISARAPQSALQENARAPVDSARHALVRRGLVIAEIALAAVLLVGAGLLARSFMRLLDVELGFEPSRAVAARLEIPAMAPEHRLALTRELTRRVSALPGVEAAGVTDALPLDRNRSWGIHVPGQEYPDNQRPTTFAYVVSPGYLQAMGIRLTAGRDFSEHDLPRAGEPNPGRVAIINQTLARRLFHDADPIGRAAMTRSTPLTIVGVVDDVRQMALDEAPAHQLYVAMAQGGAGGLDLVVRTSMTPSALVPLVRRTLADVDSRVVAADVRPVGGLVDRAVSPRRFLVSLLGGFSLMALLLASLGVYGVVSYGVSRRIPEIGIRMALGATGADVRRQILADTLGMAAVGIVLGAVVSLGLSQVIGTLLYATSPTDPLTFMVMALVLGGVAAVVGYIPAVRASRVDPMQALRTA